MKKRIRFGGPQLPQGKHTRYEIIENGKRRSIRAEPGHEVDADVIVGHPGRGGVVNDAEHYVRHGLATYVKTKRTTKDDEGTSPEG